MGLADIVGQTPSTLSIVFIPLFLLASSLFYLFSRPSIPKNAPKLAAEQWPIIGAMKFFGERYDWFARQAKQSVTGNFSFYVGAKPVVGITGENARRIFFDSRTLAFGEGYGGLLLGAPEGRTELANDNSNLLARKELVDDFSAYFSKRLIMMLKGNQLAKGLPDLLKDTRDRLDVLARDPSHMTNPFDSIYDIVYQLTMRTVACHEIAGNDELRERSLRLFEMVDISASSWTIMYPWMPVTAKIKRTYAGTQLYLIFKKIIDDRRKEGRHEDDALQFLLDQGDDVTKIITFVLGALFAGQLNSGINAAYILVYLTTNHDQRRRVFAEVNAAADKHCADTSLPLKDRLMRVPINAWETEFPLIDACLRETIRLQMPGAAFRKNISGHDIPLNDKGTEVIPNDTYVAYAIGDVHLDPAIYPDPMRWDPDRYSPERAEDKRAHHAGVMWGVSRHPCLGMRFAKLENNIITAFFLAYFDDLELLDAKGTKLQHAPLNNPNNSSARKPDTKYQIRYTLRK